ncbi:MAG TPA: CRISPR-associated endonuclease Cas1, partial [Acidimicrobiales bacterium]|nr:CRISPR-associated endonuclease Cas1 [Acidimicrobiales bacterium]
MDILKATEAAAPLDGALVPAAVKIHALSAEDVADARCAIEATYSRPGGAGVCVADGFGVKLTVNRGALVIEDGIGTHRRNRRYDRATHGLRRLVLIQPEGFVTFEALRWCTSLGVGVVVLGTDGTPTLASTARVTDDARLRRVQALAPTEPVGLGIARYLLSAKVAGQARLAAQRFAKDDPQGRIPGTEESFQERSATIAELAEAIKGSETIEEARQLEASAAALYFGAWAGRPETTPSFVAKDRARVPAHWSRFEGRRSVLASASANRKAERPMNALLNYLFALLEAEAILACQAVGLDPGLGIVHNDAKGRQSLALDIMEPVRPEVEAFVLDMLEARTFRKAEFAETEEGHVRLRAPLTHELAETMPRWAKALAPIAEKVAHLLGHAMEGKYTPATPLTSAKLRTAQAVVRARKTEARGRGTRDAAKQRPTVPVALPLYSC